MNLLPHWPWFIWALLVMVALMVVTFEGSYRQLRAIYGARTTPHNGDGGKGGDGTIVGDSGVVIGGRGGKAGYPGGGRGGDGGSGSVSGRNAMIIGGDGGDAFQPDGRGGRGAMGPIERMSGPTSLWKYGSAGSGSNDPEYDRRVELLTRVRREYLNTFPDRAVFVNAGIDTVPISWVNKRLEELEETWRIQVGPEGYIMPKLYSP